MWSRFQKFLKSLPTRLWWTIGFLSLGVVSVAIQRVSDLLVPPGTESTTAIRIWKEIRDMLTVIPTSWFVAASIGALLPYLWDERKRLLGFLKIGWLASLFTDTEKPQYSKELLIQLRSTTLDLRDDKTERNLEKFREIARQFSDEPVLGPAIMNVLDSASTAIGMPMSFFESPLAPDGYHPSPEEENRLQKRRKEDRDRWNDAHTRCNENLEIIIELTKEVIYES